MGAASRYDGHTWRVGWVELDFLLFFFMGALFGIL